MRTLAIDSATQACSVALLDNGNCIAGEWELLGRGHAERLVPMIAELPDRGRAERILVSLGPGSFTGVRVGLAAARALALAWKVPVSGFATLALVAAMARQQCGAQDIAVAMTGGHGEWFLQEFAGDGSTLQPLASVRPQDAAATARCNLVVGSEAEALVSLRGHGDAQFLLPDARRASLLREVDRLSTLSPIYGRAPDARLPAAS